MQDIVSKLQKLLSLSKRGTQHEAEVAMAKAQEMAVRYNLNLSTIQTTPEAKEEPMVKGDQISMGQRLPVPTRFVSWILESHFNVRIIYWGNRDTGRKVSFIGTNKDVQMANYLFGYLNNVFMELWRAYQKESGCPTSSRNSYLEGLYDSFNQKLRDSKKETEQQFFTTRSDAQQAQQNYSLMLVSHKERLNKSLHDFYPNLRKGSGWSYLNRGDYGAYARGQKDGDKISYSLPIQ